MNWSKKRARRIVYNDKSSLFKELLDNGSFVLIHIENIKLLVTENYESKHQFSPAIMQETLSTICRGIKVLRLNLLAQKNMALNFWSTSLQISGPYRGNIVKEPLTLGNFQS